MVMAAAVDLKADTAAAKEAIIAEAKETAARPVTGRMRTAGARGALIIPVVVDTGALEPKRSL